MIQNLIALIIVFTAVGYTIYTVIKSLTAKKSAKCGGCSDCSFRESPIANTAKVRTNNYNPHNFMILKNGK